jgi:exosome complex RNA-binding protein Rrp42 (RNase PH superfamily)
MARLPLTGRTPVPLTCAWMDDIMLCDPTRAEEELAESLLTVVCEAGTQRLVYLRKTGGGGVSDASVDACVAAAQLRATEITALIRE